ncbi:Uncharacterised protein [Weissella viridescens]|uniref:Uncharacterized protein n=1 Tax=Weissella viridescens TaxID=1629 RepID=A0A380P6G3_WEIVI|nr:Uncharacterised protein [Weissella viridescens]
MVENHIDWSKVAELNQTVQLDEPLELDAGSQQWLAEVKSMYKKTVTILVTVFCFIHECGRWLDECYLQFPVYLDQDEHQRG